MSARKRAVKESRAAKAAGVARVATAAAIATWGFAFIYHALTSTWPATPALSMLYVLAFVAFWLLPRVRLRPRRT
jgi:hypothetical protein